MKKLLIITSIFALLVLQNAKAQTVTKVFKSKFIPASVTYNGSPNPNECWESVAWGINIQVGKTVSFFTMPYQEIERLKEKIADSEVLIEVIYFDEPEEGSGAQGQVVRISLNGEVIY